MHIAIAQINPIVGDISGNAEKILRAVRQAKLKGAKLVITPELALCGYPPKDLLLRDDFYQSCYQTLQMITQEIDDITLVIGHPHHDGCKLYNSASVICSGKITHTYHKRFLSKPPFFNEFYYFDEGLEPCFLNFNGLKCCIEIGADALLHSDPRKYTHADVDILLFLNASPYFIDKQVTRYQDTQHYIKYTGVSVIHVNLVGGQDGLVFDGASFVMNAAGELVHQCKELIDTIDYIEIQNRQPVKNHTLAISLPPIASVYQALCLGVRDYVHKNNFSGVLIGLSGGVDSALVLAIAVDALGAERVKTVMMPTQYTADMSLADAREMADRLGVLHSECNIQPLFDLYLSKMVSDFAISSELLNTSTMPENLQARIRGTVLMALSNHSGSVVLTTSNKSEFAVGYCTLYGDMAGGLAVLKDVTKTLVYQLCHYRNKINPIIPERILQRAPSAELRLNQTDQDTLPPYEILDTVIEAYVEKNYSRNEIIALQFDPEIVDKIIHLIHLNEYKRHQAPIGIRVTCCDFDHAWHYPITSHYKS
ncbi:NAD+ synthase (glutamine-hydrolysing) [Nitrosomonas sp. PY1]|uniref:NAD+ synthase n=1 Tax=Nitrosomonas sp. PY1 TaxID=1803906 RepID=UPI001FC7EBAD|nr:NAD+ synthase [Nitrosomonas sp. PY1]GKS68242.1 NAD+ synthase (glutamine-hydrolysing) [Nitrosomonas sp. PY1]